MSRFNIPQVPLLLFILFLAFPSLTMAKQPIRLLEGVVTKVTDGDTINVVDHLGTKLKIRLYGIDAPETEIVSEKMRRVVKLGQPYGKDAENALAAKVLQQRVKLDVMDMDRYKRLVCLVWMGSRNINKEMVAEGWAWAYREYLDTPYASDFIGSEELARSKRLGLWQQHNPQPPREFRKRQKMLKLN